MFYEGRVSEPLCFLGVYFSDKGFNFGFLGFDKYGEFGSYPDTDKTEEELYNEMFGWESYSKDAKAYNDALEMYSRTTERQHFNSKLSTEL